MTWDFILQLISSNLFPICACIAMALYFNKMNENYRQDIKEANSTHREEMETISAAMKEMTKAVNDNSSIIQRLLDHMEKG